MAFSITRRPIKKRPVAFAPAAGVPIQQPGGTSILDPLTGRIPVQKTTGSVQTTNNILSGLTPPPVINQTQNPVQTQNNTQNPVQNPVQNPNILNTLDPNMQTGVNNNLLSMINGNAYDPYLAQSNEAFLKAAQNAKAKAASAGHLGQGSANTSMQEVDQNILSGLAEKGLNDQVAKQTMMQQGTNTAIDLAKSNSQNKLAQDSQWLQQQGVDIEKAKLYGYTDASGKHVMGSLEIQSQQFNSIMNSEAGQGFSNYVMTHKNVDYNDPTIQTMGQKLWESYGNTGKASQAWVEAQMLAVKDPSLTNPLIATKNMIDEAVKNGTMTKTQGDDMWALYIKMATNPDGVNGKIPDNIINSGTFTNPDVDQTQPGLLSLLSAANPEQQEELRGVINDEIWKAAGNPRSYQEFNDWVKSDKFISYIGTGAELRHGLDKLDTKERKLFWYAMNENNNLGSNYEYKEGSFDSSVFLKYATDFNANKTDANGNKTIYTGKDFKASKIVKPGGLLNLGYGGYDNVIVLDVADSKNQQVLTVVDQSGKQFTVTIKDSVYVNSGVVIS